MKQFHTLQVVPQFLALLMWLCLAKGQKLFKPGVQRTSSQNFRVSYTSKYTVCISLTVTKVQLLIYVRCNLKC